MPTLTVPLTQGKVALIDESDYPLIAPYRWHAVRSKNGRWYARTGIGKTGLYMHRLLTAAQPGRPVDHRNHDGLDNRRSNLRTCTTSQNNANFARHRSHNTSGYFGVTFDKQTQRYIAQIGHEGKNIKVGRFDTAMEAARARDCVARELFGEFAQFNFPDEAGLTGARTTFLRKNNTCGFHHIRLDKRDGRWGSFVHVDGKERSLGRFSDAESAARAFDEYARAHLPASTRLNFPRKGERGVKP